MITVFLVLLSISAGAIPFQEDLHGQKDTTQNPEDKLIEEVIRGNEAGSEKTKYLSTVTKYGFKNLFNQYSYNTALPWSVQVNPQAEKYMQDYLRSHTPYLLNLRKTATPYFNFIDNILNTYGLPRELKYLAVIESNLRANALSTAGALGPWQFMDYTARDYGLMVNRQVDERTDYHKSTVAAAKYLLNLYKDLKDWLLVIAAYNGGPQRVYNAIKRSGSRNFWTLQYYLPEESRNHVKKFIATHYIMESDQQERLIPSIDYTTLSANGKVLTPKLTETEKNAMGEVEITGRYKASVIAKYVDMDQKTFDRYNPGLDKALSGGGLFTLRLPGEKVAVFNDRKYDILNESVQMLLGDVSRDTKTVYGERNLLH